jgi:hypothetical protein
LLVFAAAVPRSTSIAPTKATSADTRSAVFALSARARAAAMREPRGLGAFSTPLGVVAPSGVLSASEGPRSGGGDEDLMAPWKRSDVKAA